MAKFAKTTKKKTTVRSRDARRAVSPSIDVDKSIKNAKPAETPKREPKPHVLATQDGSGIKKKQKPMTRGQRQRHMKGLERAADNMDKLELKRNKSIVKGNSVRTRAKVWDEVNAEKKAKAKKNAFGDLEEDDAEIANKEMEWVSDDEMPEIEIPALAQETIQVEEAAPAPVAAIVEDEML